MTPTAPTANEPASAPFAGTAWIDPIRIEARRRDGARLAAVKRSGLLDSPVEESFDALTRLATRLLNAPVSFVSVVDGERDFYKSHAGLPAPLDRTRDLVGRTFCHYALDRAEPLVIADTHAEVLWKSVPTVESLGVRAYIGVPLTFDGETIGSFCVVDAKPRVWTPGEIETLEQLAASIGREIGLRGALSKLRDESDRVRLLAREREALVAVVAHDLRTPLQILGLSQSLLQRKLPAPPDAALIKRMNGAVEAMQRMVDGLLSADSLLAPTSAAQVVEAGKLAEDAVDMMSPLAERSGIALRRGEVEAASVKVDYGQLLRALGNLIGNAIKYSPRGSTVDVSGRCAGALFELTVADDGPGMDEAAQTRAFDRGWQGADGMVRGDGAGLGLSIVETIVTQHGGSVRLSSHPGRGTTLTIALPRA